MPVLEKTIRIIAIALAVVFLGLSLLGTFGRGSLIARPPTSC